MFAGYKKDCKHSLGEEEARVLYCDSAVLAEDTLVHLMGLVPSTPHRRYPSRGLEGVLGGRGGAEGLKA